MSRVKTEGEVREEFLDQIRSDIHYWNNQNERDCKGKLEGLAFSMLLTLDGSTSIPGFQVIPNPHPDDKQYHIDNDEDWYPDDVDIAGGLHEYFHKK